MARIKHVDVGEELYATEWVSPDAHEVIEGGKLIVSEPPSTFHKIYNLYARKTGNTYQLVMVLESEPES